MLLQSQAQSKYAVHMSPRTGKFELFMRGLACNIVGVCLAGDGERLERRVVGRLLLQLYVGVIFAIK